jgi:hypothetical protein
VSKKSKREGDGKNNNMPAERKQEQLVCASEPKPTPGLMCGMLRHTHNPRHYRKSEPKKIEQKNSYYLV